MNTLDKTIDGKNTFHATQIAAWQRGQESVSLLGSLKASKQRTLDVPKSIDRIEQTEVKTSNPVFLKAIKTTWFESADCDKEECFAQATDLAFNILRYSGIIKSGWTGFNQKLFQGEALHVPQVGYIPILVAPAHEIDSCKEVYACCSCAWSAVHG